MTQRSIFMFKWWAVAISLICVMSYSQAQENRLHGEWVLDVALLKDGSLLPLDHPLFSTQTIYEIDSDMVKVNDIKMPAKYTGSKIMLKSRTLNYSFQQDYLCITEDGDNITLYFLRKEDFVESYPAFRPKTVEINGREVWAANALTAIDFNHELNIHDFVLSKAPLLKSKTTENLFLELEFVVDSTSHVKDIIFLTAVADKTQQQCIKAIKKAEKYYSNNTGKEIVINVRFNFFKMFDSVDNGDAKEAYQLFQKGESHFSNRNFQSAIVEFENAKNYDINIKR